MKIRFTASGSEYFRIWIVNLLLTVITLGIYWPFAKARKLRYFHENTLVGDSPLSFHGDPKRMLRGYGLMGVLGVVYVVLSNTAPLAATVMVVLTLPLAPWFLWSALRFRVTNTGWRGLRLQFDGTLKQMYRLFVPMVTPLGVAAVGWVVLLVGGEGALESTAAAIWGIVTSLCVFASMLMSIRLMWRLKEFQHSHYRLGDEVTRLEATLKDYDKVQIRIVGVLFLGGLISSALTVILVMLLGPLGGPVGVIGLYVVMLVVVAYNMARMQNLIWGGTRSEHIIFHSELRLHPLVMLMLKNAVLTIITLGFYWPFAAVALARMRLEAISLDLSIPLEQLMGSKVGQIGAAGEAAADLNPLGLDIDF